VDYSLLNEMFVPQRHVHFSDDELNRQFNTVREARGDNPYSGPLNFPEGANSRLSREDIQNNNDAYRTRLERDKQQFSQAVSARQLAIQAARNEQGSTQNQNQRRNDIEIVTKNILRDNDVRKANELVPTTLHLKTVMMSSSTGSAENVGTIDFIIGVKATMHPIGSDEMVTNLINGCKTNSKFFNMIRWTSGEISFFKDFVFNIGAIKDDVFNRSSGASPWWITLKRRRSLAKMKTRMLLPKEILPNASIVISMAEVETIRTQ